MRALVREKEKAIELRKQGYSYKDILQHIPVAKSTLSEWLKDLPLTDEEKRYLRKRKDRNISRGRIKAATALRRKRLNREKVFSKEAREEFDRFIKDPLFRVGIALYWAEGSKRSSGFEFTNSDAEMHQVMLEWAERFIPKSRDSITVRLFAHKPYAHENIEKYWSKSLKILLNNFKKTVYKPTVLSAKKRPGYKGCARLYLGGKKELVKMFVWQQCVVEEFVR